MLNFPHNAAFELAQNYFWLLDIQRRVVLRHVAIILGKCRHEKNILLFNNVKNFKPQFPLSHQVLHAVSYTYYARPQQFVEYLQLNKNRKTNHKIFGFSTQSEYSYSL